MNLDRSHLPPLRDATALGTLRSRFIIRDTVSSAADVVLPPGVLTTWEGVVGATMRGGLDETRNVRRSPRTLDQRQAVMHTHTPTEAHVVYN
jgi:hypothetical protein